MLRMSKLADYGTIVMVYLVQAPCQATSAAEISAAIGLELPTVSKLLKLLVRAQLLTSLRGAKGGYMLAQRPEKISLAAIIDAIEGYPMGLTECSSMPGLCSREPTCVIRANWQRINRSILEILDAATLAELAQPMPHAIDMRMMRRLATDARPSADEALEVKHEHYREAAG